MCNEIFEYSLSTVNYKSQLPKAWLKLTLSIVSEQILLSNRCQSLLDYASYLIYVKITNTMHWRYGLNW